ncbi:hypothetical protein DGWBC_0617 [Dehalogenimonas sp. WBC-2]|nr:hypothetical protein DGWBC_0617 [Dehalogenimonas sp. WBC-2]
MSKLPPEEMEYIRGWMTAIPESNQPFDPCDIGPYCDGDWPEWNNQSMLYWMPKDIVSKYAKTEETVLNGGVLSISPFDQIGIIAALKKHGYTVERDDELVRRAQAGHSEYHDDQNCFSDSPVWDLEEEEKE